jgi:hypothetical protein
MMRDDWQELIPFYVSGNLSEADRRTVEYYLERSPEGRQSLEDWLVIRDAVRAKSDIWSSKLPPLSAKVRSQIESTDSSQVTAPIRTVELNVPKQPLAFPNMARRSQAARSYRSLSIILSLAASLLVALVLVGLLILSSRVNDQREVNYGAAVSTSDATAIELIYITPVPRQTQIQDMGILPENSESAPTQTQQAVIEPPDAVTNSQPTQCSVQNQTNGEIPIYAFPDLTATVLRAMVDGEKLPVESFSTLGWYKVRSALQEQAGWIRATQVSLLGDCSQLPEISLTATPTALQDTCTVTGLSQGSADLYIAADRNSSIITVIDVIANVRVLGRSEDNEWYRIRFDGQDASWVGWIDAADAIFDTSCQNIVIEPVFTLSATETTDVLAQTPQSG